MGEGGKKMSRTMAIVVSAVFTGFSVMADRFVPNAKVPEEAVRRTQRLHDAKWGVFVHFLGRGCRNAAEWNEKVDRFDVVGLADQLESCGAGFFFITVMQGDRWMCAPNATFDMIAGTKPGEACSRRDLPMELAGELGKRGIDLYLYYTGDGPYRDEKIGTRFGFGPKRGRVSRDFVERWASVLGEFSTRYGEKVKGWWIDGCYSDLKWGFGYTDELLALYAKSIRGGCPTSLVAMNNGDKDYYARHYSGDDFTCGEFNDFYVLPRSRFIDGAQAFMLAPLGNYQSDHQWSSWCSPGCKRDGAYMRNFVRLANANGGVVAIDVHINEKGLIDGDQLSVLAEVGGKVK